MIRLNGRLPTITVLVECHTHGYMSTLIIHLVIKPALIDRQLYVTFCKLRDQKTQSLPSRNSDWGKRAGRRTGV